MKRARFFVAGSHGVGEAIRLGGDDAHKIVHVLRKRSGDEIEIIDSSAQTFRATLDLDGRSAFARIAEHLARAAPARFRVTVAQAIPKGDKLDFAIEKLTELGVVEVAPFISERTIAGAKQAKLERWRRIAKSAATQSGHPNVPVVSDPASFDALLRRFQSFDVVLLAWELADARIPLRDVLPGLLREASSVLVVIGPEGGLSQDEAARARECGAREISLGSHILRTETAGIALLSIINYEAGEPSDGVVVNDA